MHKTDGMKRRTRNPPNFFESWERKKEQARGQLLTLRANVLGPNTGLDYTDWMKTLPEHPLSARERLLQIGALGGPIPFEALHYGLGARPHGRFRNWWFVYLANAKKPETAPRLEIWIGSKKGVVELYVYVIGARALSTPPRSARPAVLTGSLGDCFAHARDLLSVVDAEHRLASERNP